MSDALTKSEYNIYKKIFEPLDDKGQIFSTVLKKRTQCYIINQLRRNNLVINLCPLHKTKDITTTSYYKSQYAKYVEPTGVIKKEYAKILYDRLKNIRSLIAQDICTVDDDQLTELENDQYLIENHHTITQFNNALYNSSGDCLFKYIFKNKNYEIDINLNSIQQIKIYVNSKIDILTHPARLHYTCNKCENETITNNNKIVSNSTLQCQTITEDGKRCSGLLKKPTQLTDKVAMNIYDCVINQNSEKKNIIAHSMIDLEGGEYKCAVLVLEEHDIPYLLILDVEKIKTNEISLVPIKIHEQQVLNITNMFDDVIKKQTGNAIIGMLDIKMMMVYQKLYHTLYQQKDFNIALKGDKDTGKNYVFENYGMLLYDGKFKITSGGSVSVPSLRGSAVSNNNAKTNKNRTGLLSLKDLIFVDEINMNKDLMTFLRPFLLSNTYSNDMADGDKIERIKTTHVNIAENPSSQHLGLYQGLIKKQYNDSLENPAIDNELKKSWDDHWDLYQHLWEYTNNPLLYKTIKNVRYKFLKDDVHWIDGTKLPDKDRFIADYFLKMSPNVDSMKDRAIASSNSVLTNNQEKVDVRLKLNIPNVNKFFDKYKTFINHKDDVGVVSAKVNEIIKTYNYELRSRLAKACTIMLNLNRIICEREMFNELDYDVVKRFLYFKDRAVYPEDMEEWYVPEPKSLLNQDVMTEVDEFGMSEDEFDNIE